MSMQGKGTEVRLGLKCVLTCLAARFDCVGSLEIDFGRDGVGAKATDKTSPASSSGLEDAAASLNLVIRR